MKKLLIGAAMLTMVLGARAETKQALTLHLDTGTRIVYYLDTEPSITFEGQDMVVTAEGKSAAIPMDEVTRWEMGMVDYSGIDPAGKDAEASVSVYGTAVTVTNPSGGDITIFNLNGQRVASSRQTVASFSLPSGIYVVKTANKSFKIATR